MVVKIKDLFSLEKIINSGQCFRGVRLEDGSFRFIYREHVLYIKKIDETDYDVSCDKEDWENIWAPYFDLKTDYKAISEEFKKSGNPFIKKVTEIGAGIRILKQDSWETLISFIISQNKNIPAIRTSIELLCENFGSPIQTKKERLYAFPEPKDLEEISPEKLREFKVGYRDQYIIDAREKVLSGKLDLNLIDSLETRALIEVLKTVYGVGEKVANCIALFSYHRLDAVPKDVWIKRSIKEDFKGIDYYSDFKESAGVLQQYIFYSKVGEKK